MVLRYASPHAVNRRPGLIKGYKNANLVYLIKIARALNCVKTGKLKKN